MYDRRPVSFFLVIFVWLSILALTLPAQNPNNPFNIWVLDRSASGYGFLLRPAIALHMAVGVGPSFTGSSIVLPIVISIYWLFFLDLSFGLFDQPRNLSQYRIIHSLACQSGACNSATLVAANQISNILYVAVNGGGAFPDQTSSICLRMIFGFFSRSLFVTFTRVLLTASRMLTVAATCGDGYRVGSEQCDDGNFVNGDGCDSKVWLSFLFCTEPPLYGGYTIVI
jgi:cysteine-rich repeat protein